MLVSPYVPPANSAGFGINAGGGGDGGGGSSGEGGNSVGQKNFKKKLRSKKNANKNLGGTD
jgi:hypothetical protein